MRWWSWYGKETPVLLEVAQRVFCTPATPAGVERLFSYIVKAARDCEASGYCSIGHSKQWVGDIRTGAALREMLVAVSYKALQLVSEAREMGFAHFLLISNTQAGCDEVLAFDPLLSCAWDSTEFNGKDPHVHQRLRFFGRAIRLGYNVLQNTRPDGPTAWVFRWLVEITLSAQLGRPVFLPMQTMRANLNTAATKGALEAEHALLHVMRRCILRDVRVAVLPALSVAQPELGFKTHLHGYADLYYNNMTVPNLAYGYPPALGGRLFAEATNGKYSAAWHAQLRDDCPDCPWWDEQRPLKGGSDSLIGSAGDLRLQTATYGQFVDDHLPKDTPSLPFQRCSGLGVVACICCCGEQMTGRYNWTLAAQLTAPKAPYMVSHPGSGLKLLALAPHIDLERTRDLEEFNLIVLGLLQAALLSKRVAVLPQLPCETPWLHGQNMDDEQRPTDQRCIAPLFSGSNQDWPAPLPFPVTPGSKQLLGSWTHWSNCSNNLGLLPRDSPLDVEAAQHDSQFWAKQRYSTTLTYFLDQSCAGDVGGLLPPEYAHWLQCEAPAGTQVHSSSSNTVLQVSPNDQHLHLQPSSWPGGERFRLAPGSVLQANTSRGWSWRDVQVRPSWHALPAAAACVPAVPDGCDAGGGHCPELGPYGYEPEPTLWGAGDVQVSVSTREVARQMHQVAQQPLVYLGHPILLAPPRPGGRDGDADSKAGEGTARHGRAGRYRRVMKRLRGSFCRAMFADSAQEAHRDDILMFTEEHLAAACPVAHVDRDGFLQLPRN
ncbi:hypothetical protein QJQ45_016205 [Haematococcus lacustris]|nr:hypothetical protein QJQ45_016205 [Haematococcus lacustris]